MKCLDSEQILELTLADAPTTHRAALRAHVGACAQCTARLERLQAQLGRMEKAMSWFDRDHVAERERLLVSLANVAQPRDSSVRLTRKLREVLSMRRTWIGSAAAAALVLGAFLFWNGVGASSLLAQTAQALRDVKSYQCHMTTTMPSPDGASKQKMTGKLFWAAPGSIRMESYQDDKLIEVQLMPKNKPGLIINHRFETFHRLEPMTGSVAMSPLLLMGKLADYSGQADRPLDKRQIEGVAAPGFEIALAKIDPDVGEGSVRLWIDPKTKLPLRVEMTKNPAVMVWEDFRWNVPTEQWFTAEPPARYKDETPTPPGVDEITKDIVFGLKTFAKYCGGKYPRVKMVYGDTTSEELNVEAGLPPRSPPMDVRSAVYVECVKASRGFGQINVLQRQDAGAIYHGKTVGPDDKNKVLFRWSLHDGRFRVIYGDLRVEDVTEARLKMLEKTE